MTSYGQFAYLYDQLMTHAPYDKWVRFTKEIIDKYNLAVKNIVDLGCGTGEITLKLAQEGFSVTGVDLSAEMLTVARNKADEAKITIDWIHQDIRNLNGFKERDLIISYCDVMNYIPQLVDIEIVFRNVYASLRLDGLFIFDIHSFYYANDLLMNQSFTEVSDDLCYIWECVAGDELGEMHHHLTFFERDGMLYRRYDEVHEQRTYLAAIYEQLLKKVHFRKIDFYSDFKINSSFSEKNSERIFIVAQK